MIICNEFKFEFDKMYVLLAFMISITLMVVKEVIQKTCKNLLKNWYCTIIQRTNNKFLLSHNSEASNSFYMSDRIFFEVTFPKYVNESLLLHK